MKDYFITTIQSTYNSVNLEYLEIYLSLVLNYITNSEYTESHHILPKSLFPQYKNDKWNIVKLSAKDHFLAHYYLHKALPTEPNMTFGLWGMCNQKSPNHKERDYIDSHTDEFAMIYEGARKAHSKLFKERQTLCNTMKGRTKENSPFYKKTRPKEVVDKMIANHWSKWRKPWNHNKANKDAWLSAIDAYNYWILTDDCGYQALEGKFGYPTQYLKTIHQHFRNGWIPSQDTDYLDWLALNTKNLT